MQLSQTGKLSFLYVMFITCLLLEFSTNDRYKTSKLQYSPQLTQRGIPLYACADCYWIPDRKTNRYRQLLKKHEVKASTQTTWESAGDVLFVLVIFVAATSWMFMVYLFISDHLQRRAARRLDIILAVQIENLFETSRKKG